MLTGNHLPMLCAVSRGSTATSNSWERQDRIERLLLVNARQDAIVKVRERRNLRRTERHELADEIESGAHWVMPYDDDFAAAAYEEALAWANYEGACPEGGYLVTGESFDLDAYNALDVDAIEAELFGEFDVTSYKALAAKVEIHVDQVDVPEPATIDTAALYGSTFDPTECQWGFTVSARPAGSNGGTRRDEAGRWLAAHDLAAA